VDEDSFIKRGLMDEFRSTLGDLEDRIGSTGRSGHCECSTAIIDGCTNHLRVGYRLKATSPELH
jgi:hypothetical protein